jgi:UDP-N-acetylmuramoyl-tripeptide--D-alanyl-D-alanine ligase
LVSAVRWIASEVPDRKVQKNKFKSPSNRAFFLQFCNMEKLFELFYQCSGICTDTRNIQPNTLFVALKGDHFNGNEFAKQAIASGASYAIVDEFEVANNTNIFYVEDSLIYLQQLANYHRNKFDIPVIGITGSNGKTSTKELVNAVLSKKYKTLCTIGNLNNHIGVPLTLLRLTDEHQIGIIEMGANKPGDIAELCTIAEPTHGIITNIGKAHLEGFINFEGVLKTKTELYESIQLKNGVLFACMDDAILMNACKKHPLPLITFGSDSDALIVGELNYLDPFVHFSWHNHEYHSPTLHTHLVGKYNFNNFLAAIAFGNIFQVTPEDINTAIEGYVPQNNRSQVSKTEKNTVIVDCYNANPSSMKSALESFAEIHQGAKIAILGDMLELGSEGISEHQGILAYCQENNLRYITVGPIFQSMNENGFSTTQELIEKWPSLTIENNLILLKGSRGIALEKLLPLL